MRRVQKRSRPRDICRLQTLNFKRQSLRLGLSIPALRSLPRCTCSTTWDEAGYHALTCQKDGGQTRRHDRLSKHPDDAKWVGPPAQYQTQPSPPATQVMQGPVMQAGLQAGQQPTSTLAPPVNTSGNGQPMATPATQPHQP